MSMQKLAENSLANGSKTEISSNRKTEMTGVSAKGQSEEFRSLSQANQTPGGASAIQLQMASPAALQAKELRGVSGAQTIKEQAQTGISGSPQKLPHRERIQQAFGCHDLSGVEAHVGGAAESATQAIGATAYTMGSSVAFSGTPDLSTAAHEAAHVVQQRSGVQLENGVGQPTDSYEKHADAVATRVVQGQSAADLLDVFPGGRGNRTAVQKQTDVCATPDNQPPKLEPEYKPTAEGYDALKSWLTGYIVGHGCAKPVWRFYDVLNNYLQWDENNYLIKYGRKYCRLFNLSPSLTANDVANRWVFKTTALLQIAITRLILGKYRIGQLNNLTPSELEAVAFASHAKAYTEGGLAMVLVYAPQLTPEIISIPGAEFDPSSPNFLRTVSQAIDTAGKVLPQVIFEFFSVLSPRGLRAAAAKDREKILKMIREQDILGRAERTLKSGAVDNFATLNRMAHGLRQLELDSSNRVGWVRKLIALTNERRTKLAVTFRVWVASNPAIKPYLDATQPGWAKW